VIQAESGFMELNGETNGLPTKMPVALIDVLAGHQLKEALLLAMLKKERTGEGSFVEVSLIQTAIASLANQAASWLVANKLPTRQGSAHPNIAPYGDLFETRDGKQILLAVGSDKQFQKLMLLLNKPEVAGERMYNTNEARVVNRQSLNELLSLLIRARESAALVSELHKVNVPAGLIQTVKDVFETNAASELIINSNGMRGAKTFVSSGFSSVDLLPPPHFGEHTEEVMLTLR
jgi:crotonobetainyl-CoA:carnitine CoA-transferase CaiB-like acyl-CoA transferase